MAETGGEMRLEVQDINVSADQCILLACFGMVGKACRFRAEAL
jgi:hypothetical protein